MPLSHLDSTGKAVMVDISSKTPCRRTAVASGKIVLRPETIQQIRDASLKKGDALATARIAGIMAGKKTAELIPLCHNIKIDTIGVDFTLDNDSITITATAVCTDTTGIEMEALTAISVAALTLYDMCKAVDKTMKIGGIHLKKKQKEQVS
jgi:cyclic pyranopterin phosphate synthase